MFIVVPAFFKRPTCRSDRAQTAAALVLTSSHSGRTLLCGALAVNCGNAAAAAATAGRRAARRCSADRAQPTNHQGVDDDVWAYDEILPPPPPSPPASRRGAREQDLPNALPSEAIAEKLGLGGLKNRQWAIFKTSAIKGDGLFDGLDWLVASLREGRK